MKKLSLLMFAILILGCGTEKPAVEEPPPVIEQPPPAMMEPKPSHHPLIAKGPVKHGQINVDPEPLNRDGLEFEFTEDISSLEFELLERDDANLPWELIFIGWNPYELLATTEGPFKYDTEYKLVMHYHDSDCESGHIVIEFRTKPRRPVVGQAAPVIQERIPVAPLGERFQLFDRIEPVIVDGDVIDGEINVDPEPLNENGIQIEFNRPIRRYKIDLRLHKGATLGWLPHDLVKNDMGKRIQITPAEGFPLLEFDTSYQIDIFVEDSACLTGDFTIIFVTMPKP